MTVVDARDGRKHRLLVFGRPRAELAAILFEYRRFAAAHSADPLASDLRDVARCIRDGLREERRIARAIGWSGKVNSHLEAQA